MDYIFEIIPSEQTPKVVQIVSGADYIKANNEKFEAFLGFAQSQTTAVGLAANQCSLNGKRFNQRIFAMRNIKTLEWELIIDPKIVKYIGIKEQKLEGCLTWKGQNIVADRYRAVHVTYFDLDGNQTLGGIEYGGFQGQIFQHEYNHIEGIPEEVVEASYELPTPKKIQRNEKCPCGSGLKYKQCCLQYEY